MKNRVTGDKVCIILACTHIVTLCQILCLTAVTSELPKTGHHCLHSIGWEIETQARLSIRLEVTS